ncbi:MAG TPA: hypothetical protein PL133_10175 [Methylophilaceae bacterium]|nr:hypothetical protein [Methylophilaceae bacterium]
MRLFWTKLLLTSASTLVFTAGVFAQDANADSNKQSAENVAPSEKPYIDQVIDDGNLKPAILFGENDDPDYDPSGLPHYLRIEAVSSISKHTGTSDSEENGLAITSQFDTQHYGAFSINGVFRNEPVGKAASILQRGMPFNDGWYANNGVGTLYTPSIDLARSQHRFYLPTFPVLGVSTEWLHQRDLQLQFATGTPGIFDGLQLNGFSTLGGSLTMAGAQWNASPNWQLGAQMIDANQVSTSAGSTAAFNQFFGLAPEVDETKTSAQSFYGSAAWLNADTRIQANILQSQHNTTSNGTGIWIDANKRIGSVTHQAGIFRLDPDLAWGYTPISNNVKGTYYRANYISRQWLLDGGFDMVRNVSGSGANGVLLTGSARYQVNQALGIGASTTYRHAETDARSGYIFADKLNQFGTGRAQLDYSAERDDRVTRLTLSQGWRLSVGSRLNTSLYTEVENNAGERIQHFGVALNGGSDLFNNISWNGNLSYDKSNGNGATKHISANLDLTARLSNHWSLIASYLESKNTTTSPFIIQPLIPVQSNSDVTRGSALFVTLRYETRGGSTSAPLGGVSGSAAGSISGYLFLDANDNNLPDANEEPAQNITVLLDGKFSTRTNALGRFEFPLVASGEHTITVIADNLPLPWQVSDNGQRSIKVNTRETNYINIPASRLK